MCPFLAPDISLTLVPTDINIPIFLVLYLGYKITFRTKFWKPQEMDFVTVSFNDNLCSIFVNFFILTQGIPTPEETETPETPPKNFAERVANIIF